jgi:hypothetical protein
VTSYGRSELTRYAESLLDAVKVWRDAGAWRSNRTAAAARPSAAARTSTPTAGARQERNVISFTARRPPVTLRPRPGSSYELERADRWLQRSLYEQTPLVSRNVFLFRAPIRS